MSLALSAMLIMRLISQNHVSQVDAPVCEIELIHVPKGAEVADYYPEASFPQRLSGDTEIDCVIDKNLKLTKCIVIAESPKGYGFGAATIKYFKKNALGKAVDANGQSCIGRHISTKFHWQYT